MPAEVPEKPGVPGHLDRTDRAQDAPPRQYRKKAQTNHGIGEQAGRHEVRIVPCDHLVELRNGLGQLGADATDQEIAKRWEFAKQQCGAGLPDSVRLEEGRENDLRFSHAR